MPDDGKKILQVLDLMASDARAGGRRLDRAEYSLRQAQPRPKFLLVRGGLEDDPDITPYTEGPWWDDETEVTRPIHRTRRDVDD